MTLTPLPPAGQFQSQFDAESNCNQTAEHCSDAMATKWMVLTNIIPLPAPADIVSSAVLTDSNRIYCSRAAWQPVEKLVSRTFDWLTTGRRRSALSPVDRPEVSSLRRREGSTS